MNVRYREVFERSRNRWLWRSWVAPALYAAFSGVADAIRWTQNHVEVGLFGLANEVAAWPDKYVIYKHGVTEQNPHVWTPVKRVIYADQLAERQEVGRWYFVELTRPDERCTCGMYKSDWIAISKLRNLAAQADLANCLQGAADPSAGGGVAAAIGSFYMRPGDNQTWLKTGADDTAWTLLQ